MCKARRVPDVLQVAVDATPLLGVRTGVGMFCEGALSALADRRDLSVRAYAVTWRRRHLLAPVLPAGVVAHQRAMPARPLHWAWGTLSAPPAEWFVGAVDVVHGTNFVGPPTRRAARVVTVHDLTAVRYPELCDGPSLRFPDLVRRAMARGAWVHTPSQFVAEEVVAELGGDPERVRAVHHGVPLQRRSFAVIGEREREAVELPAGVGRYVLAVGTVEPRKDLPGLVRAFDAVGADLPDVALVLAGPDGWGTAALEQAMAASRVRQRIIRLGYVSPAMLRRLLAGAAVLAYPSVYEGFGFPPLEAMAAGIPVVSTTAGALPEVLGDAAVLVPPGDPDALAAALVAVLGEEGVRDELVARGRDRSARYTWEACASGLAALYDAAASDSPARRPARAGSGRAR